MKCHVTNIPGYYIDSDTLFKEFATERDGVKDIEGLLVFISKWKIIWMLSCVGKPRFVKLTDARIVKGDFDKQEALECIAAMKSGKNTCGHAVGGLCPGAEIMLPYALVRSALTAINYNVPIGVALHQIFCRGSHEGCFQGGYDG